MISQETLSQLQELGEEIRRDKSVVGQRSIDICWHWWKVGRALAADPDLYVKGTMTLSVETSIRICEVLGLSTKLAKPPRARPGGEVAVRRAIDTYNRFPDEQAAKEAIETAGTYHNLSKGSGYSSRLAKSMSVPVGLLDYIQEHIGVEDKNARKYIAAYLRNPEIQEDIVEFIKEEQAKPGKQRKS